jgi:nitrate/TMAO reductase-like tetraheme cytochrome c subunit
VRLALLPTLVTPSAAFAVATVQAIPRPKGWIGTADQWTQGLGIALAVLNLAVLVIAWRHLSRSGSLQGAMGTLFFGLAVLPLVVVFFGYAQGMAGMETVRACGGCHVMAGHVADLRDPDSESLAAVHFKNHYIQENQCYTCHSDYGLLGTFDAKVDGMRHVFHFLTGTFTLPLRIAHPYSNAHCLQCHAESQKFLKSSGHPAEIHAHVLSGEMSCMTCHAPAHTPAPAKEPKP